MEQWHCIWNYTSVEYLLTMDSNMVKIFLQNKIIRYCKLNEIVDYDQFKEFGQKFLTREQMIEYFNRIIASQFLQETLTRMLFFKNVQINRTIATNNSIILFDNIFPIQMYSGTIIFKKNNINHRENDLPSLIKYTNGYLDEQWWYINGEPSRIYLSAFEKYYNNGTIKYQRWYKNGLIHRDNEPALLSFYPNGKHKKQKWFKNGESHRNQDLPSEIKTTDTGIVIAEKWYYKNRLHRNGNPAWIEYYKDGTKSMERWYTRGLLHKQDGQAIVQYYMNGTVKCGQIWLDGLFYKNTNYLNKL